MSSWDKYLIGPIVVPAGGWVFKWSSVSTTSVTIASGSYDNILYLLSTLEGLVQGVVSSSDITLSASGITSITIAGMTGILWADTANSLEETLGFNTTETVSGSTIQSSEQHLFGWYPGVLSRGSTCGAGVMEDSEWRAESGMDIRVKDGNGSMAWLAPARKPYTRTIKYTSIQRDEAYDRKRGPVCFEDRWSTKKAYWYLDRDVGAVGSHGTQIDPGAPNYEEDDDGDYYIVYMNRDPMLTELSTPDSISAELEMHVEPK